MNHSIQEEHLMEFCTLAFPRKDRILGFLKGASGGIEPHPLGACLEHLPDHADRGFHTFHEGLFRLGKVVQTARTFVNDTAPMMLRCISRMSVHEMSSESTWRETTGSGCQGPYVYGRNLG